MKKEFVFLMFCLCFCFWVIVVDNLMMPDLRNLNQDNGLYSRYKIRKAIKDGDLDLMKDKILIYAHVKDRERFYYIDHTPFFEATLNKLEPGTRIKLRYTKAFPKFWQKTLYDVQVGEVPVLRYSQATLDERQAFNWIFTGIIGGIFIVLSGLGLVVKPRKKNKK